MTSRPIWRAISTVSSRDTSSTRMIRPTISCGMSAYVRSSVLAALYAGMTTTTVAWRAGASPDAVIARAVSVGAAASAATDTSVIAASSGCRGWANARAEGTPCLRRGASRRQVPISHVGATIGPSEVACSDSIGVSRMLDRLIHGREKDPSVAERIPPGQYRTEKFPVLHYGSVPKTDLRTWDFRVYG